MLARTTVCEAGLDAGVRYHGLNTAAIASSNLGSKGRRLALRQITASLGPKGNFVEEIKECLQRKVGLGV